MPATNPGTASRESSASRPWRRSGLPRARGWSEGAAAWARRKSRCCGRPSRALAPLSACLFDVTQFAGRLLVARIGGDRLTVDRLRFIEAIQFNQGEALATHRARSIGLADLVRRHLGRCLGLDVLREGCAPVLLYLVRVGELGEVLRVARGQGD